MNRLTVLSYSSRLDKDLETAFNEWAKSDLLQQVAVCDLDSGSNGLDMSVEWFEDGLLSSTSLGDVLTRRIWEHVTFVALRPQSLDSYESVRFDAEVDLARTIQGRFIDQSVIRCYTLGIAQSAPVFSEEVFHPIFNAHFLHDTVMIADADVATLPLDKTSRVGVCLMSAVAISGGLRWQIKPTLDIIDRVGSVRLIRTHLRAINAGRFIDDVVAGAFPESGPWTSPPELKAVQAPPGASISESLLEELAEATRFGCEPYVPKRRKQAEEIGLVEGLLLFGRNFVVALKQAPFIIIDQYVESVGDRVANAAQRLTYGGNSSKILAFRPKMSRANSEELLAELEISRMPDIDPPAIPDPQPWNVLRQTSLSLVDGGELPDAITAPRHNTSRILYTDPWAIGPAPSDQAFVFTDADRDLLGMEASLSMIEPMDVQNARAVDLHFETVLDLLGHQSSGETGDEAVQEPVKASQFFTEDVITEVDGYAAVAEASKFQHDPNHAEFSASAYRPIAFFYRGENSEEASHFQEQLKIYDSALENYQVFEGRWKKSNGCDFCGAKFHYGSVYLHEPSQELIHVGHICASKFGLETPSDDALKVATLAILGRWQHWLGTRQNSLLWRVGERISNGVDNATNGLVEAARKVSVDSNVDMSADANARERLGKWGKIFLFSVGLFAVSVFAVWALALLPLIYVIGGGLAGIGGVVIKIGLLARDLARLQTRLMDSQTSKQRAVLELQHYARQLSQLNAVQNQFADWQQILRAITHTPFGTPPSVTEDLPLSVSVVRPHSFVYGASRPSPEQLTQAQLNARRVTIHQGWMGTVFHEMKSCWQREYERVLLDSPPDPEGDNSPPFTIRVRLPGNNEPIYGPRQDFTIRCTEGSLQTAVIGSNTSAILEWIKDVPLDELLSPINVTGSGAALNGLSATRFLDGARFTGSEATQFDPTLFGNSTRGLQLRDQNVEEAYPLLDAQSLVGSVEGASPGRDLLFAQDRITVSPQFSQHDLAGVVRMTGGRPTEEGGGEPRTPIA